MNDEIHAYLDGERRLEELSPDSRTEAERWRSLLRGARAAGEVGAPPWLEGRIMAGVEAAAAARLPNLIASLLRPRTFRVSPVALGAAALVLAALLAIPWLVDVGPRPAAGVLYVQFSLEAPGARTVAVAGDFTGWDAHHPLEDPDGDGVWTARVALDPGVHRYMFVIDESRWVTDPLAERYADDGFGNRNAVVAVTSLGGA